jgi:hypothetical protein
VQTFAEAKPLVEDPRFARERAVALARLDLGTIDEPIVDVVRSLSALPHCFTLQSCYGHFVCTPEQDPHTLDPVPPRYTGPVRYRIAYLAICIENSPAGGALLQSLRRVTAVDPDYVQLGSAEWFWERRVNTYALQVEPEREMGKDETVLPAAEARHVQDTRDRFFAELRELLAPS